MVALALLALLYAVISPQFNLVQPPKHVTASTPVVVDSPSPSPSASPASGCGPERPSHNYTDAPKGTGPGEKENNNSFGPPAVSLSGSTDAAWVGRNLERRLYGDPVSGGIGGDWRLLTALKSGPDRTDANMHIANFAEWCKLVTDFLARMQVKEVVHYSLHGGPYATMSMTRATAAGELPTVNDVWVNETEADFAIVEVKTAGGIFTMPLRLQCGYQPWIITLG